MKSIKTMIFGLIALGACATAANATTVRIYINGSTAFRTAAVASIENLFTSYAEVYAGSLGTADAKQDAAIYSGVIKSTIDPNTPTAIIKTSWLGSESGIQAVADALGTTTANFLSDNPSTNGNTGSVPLPSLGGTTTTTMSVVIDDPTFLNTNGTIGQTGNYDAESPSACFSDTFQATSQYNASASIKYTTTGITHTFNALTGANNTDPSNPLAGSFGIVAVVPFMFEATQDASLTNVSADTAKHLYASGFLPRAFFTGVTSDTNVRVYATGRNPDSGTRLTTFADIGSGALTTVKQYEPFDGSGNTITTSGATIATIELWPVDTVNQISIAAGNSGFDSSTFLGNALAGTTTSMQFKSGGVVSGPTGGDIVGYVTASASPTSPGHALTYNGFAPTALNVLNGVYGFWTYEHLYYTSSTTGDIQTVLDGLATTASEAATTTTTGTQAPLSCDVMNVFRQGTTNYDGQEILPNYNGF